MQIAYVLYWWLALAFIGLISFPLVSRICGSLEDKGYSISKIVGLIFLTFVSWMLASLKILPFGYGNIAVSILILAAVSFFFGKKNLKILEWPRKKVLISELVFTAAFILLLLIQSTKSDISYYYYGSSDTLFNYAFIQSILRGGYSPPIDPWFAGGSIPYYYGGHYLVALLTKFTGVPPAIAFNVAIAMLYAFAIQASYGLGYNISKRKLYGIIAVLFVCVVGYTSGALQLVANATNHTVLGYPPIGAKNIADWMLNFDFWSATWFITGAIVHYPAYSFLMGDMHTYFISIPFQIVYITLIFSIYRKSRVDTQFSRSDVFLIILVLSICLGFFFMMNTWEYPTYVIFTIAAFILMKPSVCLQRMPYICRLGGVTSRIYAIVLSPWRSKSSIEGTSRPKFFKQADQLFYRTKVIFRKVKPYIGWNLFIPLAVACLSFILYLPYYLSKGLSGFHGIELLPSGLRTSFAEFLEYCAPFLFIIITFLLILWKREFFAGKRTIIIAVLMLIPIILLAVFLHFQILAIVVPIGLLCLYFLYKSKERSEREFILLLIIMGMTLAFFCDFAYINDIFGGDWERFNTVMKVYYQLWIFLSISAAYGVYYILHNLKTKKNVWLGIIKAGWVGLLVVLIIAALIHPIATTVSMIGGRHATWWEGEIGTLDGFAFIESIDEGDYCAIQWLNDNIGGSPVILEMPGEQWSYSSRVSGYTGLPTVIGWQGNFEVVFGRDGGVVATRAKDVDLIYNTSDNDEAIELLNKYDVEYIYMGTLEKNKYSSEGLQKFDTYTNSYDLIYQNKGVAIYQLKED